MSAKTVCLSLFFIVSLGAVGCGSAVMEPSLPPEGVAVEYFEPGTSVSESGEVEAAVSCSSKDGNKDCFCGSCGCWRTQTDCGCSSGGATLSAQAALPPAC
jgi:hypothetical protein